MPLVLLYLAVIGLMIASAWMIYSKAGEAGWKSIVPVYGAVVFLRIVGRPWWWLLLLMIPIVNIIPAAIVCVDLARVFGRGVGFAVGLMLLGFIFLPMLAFGSARYQGTSKSRAAAAKPRPTQARAA